MNKQIQEKVHYNDMSKTFNKIIHFTLLARHSEDRAGGSAARNLIPKT